MPGLLSHLVGCGLECWIDTDGIVGAVRSKKGVKVFGTRGVDDVVAGVCVDVCIGGNYTRANQSSVIVLMVRPKQVCRILLR